MGIGSSLDIGGLGREGIRKGLEELRVHGMEKMETQRVLMGFCWFWDITDQLDEFLLGGVEL